MKKEMKKKVVKPVDAIKKFGFFNDKMNEFVIITPQTPRPWKNRIGNEQIRIEISNHGNGTVAWRDDKNDVHSMGACHVDRFIYVYDRKEKELWSPTWFPVNTKLDSYEVRHGLQYTVFKASRNDVEIIWSVTVHHADATEIWRLNVNNHGRRETDLLVVPFYHLGARSNTYCSGSAARYRSFVSKQANCICVKSNSNDHPAGALGNTLCFHANRKFSKYEMNLDCFLKGFTPLTAPGTVFKDDWTNSFIDGDERPCLAAGFDFKLKRDQDQQIDMEIFFTDNFERAEKLSAMYAEGNAFEASMKKHGEDTARILSINNIKTASLSFDRYVNVWIKHQLWHDVTGIDSEFQCLQETMSNCDMFRAFDPMVVRTRLLQAATRICQNGSVSSSFSLERERSRCTNGVWFQITLCQYIRETGDLAILNEEIPYHESEERGSVLAHLKRTIEFMEKQKGSDNICRMDFTDPADDKDVVPLADCGSKAQSIEITLAYIFGLKNLAALLKILRDPESDIYASRAKELTEIINSKFFEDDRYVCSVTDEGLRIGSKQNGEGKIWIEPQGLALMSGVADHEKTLKIIATMRKELYQPYGVMSLAPIFTEYSESAGPVSVESPGSAGNGSIDLPRMFLYIYGLIRSDMSDEAYDLINRVLPTNPKNPPERGMVEPFQMADSFQGPASRNSGRGTSEGAAVAGFFLKSVWDGMIGIFSDFDCVKVNARLPKAFGDRVEVSRIIRGRSIRFEIAKPGSETKNAPFTMRVKNGADISYKDISDDEYILVIV